MQLSLFIFSQKAEEADQLLRKSLAGSSRNEQLSNDRWEGVKVSLRHLHVRYFNF